MASDSKTMLLPKFLGFLKNMRYSLKKSNKTGQEGYLNKPNFFIGILSFNKFKSWPLPVKLLFKKNNIFKSSQKRENIQ